MKPFESTEQAEFWGERNADGDFGALMTDEVLGTVERLTVRLEECSSYGTVWRWFSAEHLPVPRKRHTWQRGRFTGAITCSACGLLPVHDGDSETPCEA